MTGKRPKLCSRECVAEPAMFYESVDVICIELEQLALVLRWDECSSPFLRSSEVDCTSRL